MTRLRINSYWRLMSAFALFLFFIRISAHSQVYNNEWIASGQMYYKFKVGADGLYRLSGISLSGLAVGNTAASNFQLWHNGKQFPVYTSTTGVLGSAGYIEFWGEANDGRVDEELFRKPEDQLNTALSFEGDSATYFLTVNSNTAQNLRYSAVVNDVAGKAGGLTVEPYFYYTTQKELGTTLNRGPATPYGSDYVYMSDYRGKSFGAIVKGGASKSVSFTNLFAYPGVSGTVSAGVSGSSPLGNNNRVVTVTGSDGSSVNGKLGNFASQLYVLGSAQVSSSYTVTVKNGAANTNDQINASFVSLRYPRVFNFGGQAQFSFDLAASSSMRYLKISGFDAGGSVPVLYDITGKKRYVAVVSGSDYQFVLPAMGASHLALVGQSTSSYTTIGAPALQMRQYPDLTSSSQQGDYLIISNKALYGSGNYVAQYSAYRSSAAGGSYTTRIYNIDDLEDMFAFGIHSSPLSIRNFLRYARSHFSTPPKFVFLIGRGLSFDNLQGANASDPEHQGQNLVPTYGWPASDVMLSSANFEPVAATPIGRLSAVKPEEIRNYLDKVKAYEASQKSDDNTIANNSWKKNVVLISGGGNAGEEGLFSSYLNSYRTLLKDSLYGANSHYLSKVTSDEVSSTDANALKSYFSAGIGLISYFGHGASTTIGYGELNDPSVFNNNGRYPVMFTSGCDVGDCFAFMPGRISTINNITERYLFTKDKGSVAFIAQSYLGVTSFLQSYNLVMYKNLASIQYGQPISYSLQASQAAMITPGKIVGGDTVTAYAHAEQTNFLGDPAIRLNSFAKPDFVVQESEVYTPSSLSITENKFHVKAYLYNIGRAQGDTVLVSIKRKLPDGSQVTVLEKELPSIRYMDSLEVDIPIDPNKDAGNNEITVSVDADNRYNELSESNNIATKTVYIYANGITPVYPYNYSIIRSPSAVLIASTSDALAAMDTYVMELDTSEQFTSASKITKTVKSIGGALSFDPGISYKDSTVYYWRVSPVPKSGDGYRWAGSSFQYIAPAGSDKAVGAGQSQYYQHTQSILEGLRVDSVSRKLDFNDRDASMLIGQAVVGSGIPTGYSNFKIIIGSDAAVSSFYCTKLNSSLLFNIFNPHSLKPYINQSVPSVKESGAIGGFMGSTAGCMTGAYSYDTDPIGHPNTNKSNFQFTYQTSADRDKIAAFVDWIPDGTYVVMRLFVKEPFANVPLIDAWKSDASGSASLYSKLVDQGVSMIDDFTVPQAGVFIFKKNDNKFIPVQRMTGDVLGQLMFTETLKIKDTIGYVTSPKFGPAKSWQSVQWNGSSEESVNTDHATVDVIGITANGSSKVLYTLDKTQQNTNISSIDAAQYPYVQLKLRNVDSVNYTPYQLRYWHVLYTPVPEGALAGNIKLEKQDTIDLGQDLRFSIAFKNVSDQVFSDSIKATVSLRDKSNKLYTIPIRKLKKLNPGDTAMINVTIPGDYTLYNEGKVASEKILFGTSMLGGLNTLNISINPDDDPMENSLMNNVLQRNILIQSTALPVVFGNFTVALMQGNKAFVKWNTLTELNSDYYTIQRSVDGKNFMDIGKKKGMGNSAIGALYSFIDNLDQIPEQQGVLYYRIVATDLNGHNFYSKIVTVHPLMSSWRYKIAPNPVVQDQINLTFEAPEASDVLVRLMNMSGSGFR